MRFLLVFLVVLILAWRWRTWREAGQQAKRQKSHATPPTTNTVICNNCGIHIPASDALVGALGVYCSSAHRLQMEP